jgi:hypothetical protein
MPDRRTRRDRGDPPVAVDRPRSLRELNRATLARQGLLERARGPVAEVIGRHERGGPAA